MAHVLIFTQQYPQVLLGRAVLNPLITQPASSDSVVVVVLSNMSCAEPHGVVWASSFAVFRCLGTEDFIVSWNKCLRPFVLRDKSNHTARLQLAWSLQVGFPFHP